MWTFQIHGTCEHLDAHVSILYLLAQAEIVDETDIYEDVNRRVLRRGGARADVATYLTMFEHKLHATALSVPELAAVAAFLQLNVEEFGPLTCFDQPLKVPLRVALCVAACLHGCSTMYMKSGQGPESTEAAAQKVG